MPSTPTQLFSYNTSLSSHSPVSPGSPLERISAISPTPLPSPSNAPLSRTAHPHSPPLRTASASPSISSPVISAQPQRIFYELLLAWDSKIYSILKMGCTPQRPELPPYRKAAQFQSSANNHSSSSPNMRLELSSHIRDQSPRGISSYCRENRQPSLILNPSVVEVVGSIPVIDGSKMVFTEIRIKPEQMAASRQRKHRQDQPTQIITQETSSLIDTELLPPLTDPQELNPPPIYSFAYAMK